jgi:hypothetical protein
VIVKHLGRVQKGGFIERNLLYIGGVVGEISESKEGENAKTEKTA